LLALITAAAADEPLKIATSAVTFAEILAKSLQTVAGQQAA